MDSDIKDMFSWSLFGCMIGIIAAFSASRLEIPYSALGVFSALSTLGATLIVYGLYQLRQKSLFVLGLWIVLIGSVVCAMQYFGMMENLYGYVTASIVVGLSAGILVSIIASIALVRQFIEDDDD